MVIEISPLEGRLRPYPWGGDDFIRRLVRCGGEGPAAEWWLGAHPDSPSILHRADGPIALDRAVADDPIGLMGAAVAARFERLPFLFKVLDVERMLSIQVHPDREQARLGFGREAGLPPEMHSYHDDNHKPEMMVALDTFHLLHGFREPGRICLHLDAHASTRDLASRVADEGIAPVYAALFTMPPAEIEARIRPIVDGLERWPAVDRGSPEHWLARAVATFGNCRDPGLFAFFFLNLVALEPGQAIYQPARLLHAYLHGRCIELMANSDNVLRAGLTTKRVDHVELLAVVDVTPEVPHLHRPHPIAPGVLRYPVLCDDFSLDEIDLGTIGKIEITALGPEILFVMDGTATLRGAGFAGPLARGEAVFVTAGSRATLSGDSDARVFRVQAGLVVA